MFLALADGSCAGWNSLKAVGALGIGKSLIRRPGLKEEVSQNCLKSDIPFMTLLLSCFFPMTAT